MKPWYACRLSIDGTIYSGDRTMRRTMADEMPRRFISNRACRLIRIGFIVIVLSARRLLDDANLVLVQAVEAVDEPVDLPVGRVDLGLKRGFVMQRLRLRQLLVRQAEGAGADSDAPSACH
jgi:hypothetical protein